MGPEGDRPTIGLGAVRADIPVSLTRLARRIASVAGVKIASTAPTEVRGRVASCCGFFTSKTFGGRTGTIFFSPC